MRGGDVELALWDEFLGAFFDHFFPQELRKAKVEKFVNMKQGMMSVKEHALKFQKLFHYASESVANMISKMRKFASSLSHNFVLKCKVVMLNNDIDSSRLVICMQQVKD